MKARDVVGLLTHAKSLLTWRWKQTCEHALGSTLERGNNAAWLVCIFSSMIDVILTIQLCVTDFSFPLVHTSAIESLYIHFIKLGDKNVSELGRFFILELLFSSGSVLVLRSQQQ
jgi:hypothetical protein